MYDPLTELAKLWVDGMDTGVDFLPRSSTSGSWLSLSAGEAATQAHWHEITLTIVPEPATVALMAGLGPLLIVIGVRSKRR